jgi:hypothetical protein
MPSIAVTTTAVDLTVDSPATSVDAVVYTLATEAMAAGLSANASFTPSAISPPSSGITYSPVLIAVRCTGTIQCVPPPLAPPSTWREPARLLPSVVVTTPTPAISNGQPVSPKYWGQTSSSMAVT